MCVIFPLALNPHPKRLVLLVPSWHDTMAILQFKIAQLFVIHIPFLFTFRHGSQEALLKSKKMKVGGCGIAKRQSVLLTT
jgi:hypothetical protein